MNFNHLTDRTHLLQMIMKTWSRDSHGLYDFESTQIKPANVIVLENGILVRKKLDIKSIHKMEEIKDEEYLMEIKYEKR